MTWADRARRGIRGFGGTSRRCGGRQRRPKMRPPSGPARRTPSLVSHSHPVMARQGLDAHSAEAGLAEPVLALADGVVEAVRGLDEHVEAHEKPARVATAVVVDHRVEYDECPAGRQRL